MTPSALDIKMMQLNILFREMIAQETPEGRAEAATRLYEFSKEHEIDFNDLTLKTATKPSVQTVDGGHRAADILRHFRS